MERLKDIVELIESKRDVVRCVYDLSQEDIELIYSFVKDLRKECSGNVILANKDHVCVYDGGKIIKGVVDVEFSASIGETPTLTLTKNIMSASCRG